MTQITIEGMPEGITVGELMNLADQSRNLPEGFKIKYEKPKVQTAMELLEELK